MLIKWSNLCPACKGYPQEHTKDEHCFIGPNTFEVGGYLAQTAPDIAGRDIRTPTSDPDCEED